MENLAKHFSDRLSDLNEKARQQAIAVPSRIPQRRYLIHFSDSDVPPEFFDDEGTARQRLASLRQNWDCSLFVELSTDPAE